MTAYVCALCGGTFDSTPDGDAQARAEANALWGVTDAHTRSDFAVICDDCFHLRTTRERDAMSRAFKAERPS